MAAQFESVFAVHLIRAQVLDLHSNALTTLPEEVGLLSSLQVLTRCPGCLALHGLYFLCTFMHCVVIFSAALLWAVAHDSSC